MTKNKGMKGLDNAPQANSKPSHSARMKEDEPLLYKASEEEQRQFASNYGSELVITTVPPNPNAAMNTELNTLLDFCVSERRVAPLPEYWERLCVLIAIDTAQLKTLAPLPNTDLMYDSERRKRLADQLKYAYEQQSLSIADKYLRSLKLEQWLLNQWEL